MSSSKFLRITVFSVIAVILLAGAFSGGVVVGWALPGKPAASGAQLPADVEQTVTPAQPSSSAPPEVVELFRPFWETWDIIHDQYIDQPLDDEALMRGTIRGMLGELGDPYTSYMDPDEYLQANAPLEGEYEGIGAWVDITGEYLTIISPMPGSPAEKVGLRPDDKVIAVDGEDMTGIDGNLVLRRVLGPAGSEVRLTIQRATLPEPFEVVIVRERIVVPAVEGRLLEQNIAYVQLYTFGEKTTTELRKTLSELLAQKPVGLILDVRNNGGGYLNTAVEVISEFIPEGKVVLYEEFADGTRRTFTALRGGQAIDIPLVVLVNEGSASASEILAGAIQDYGRGKLVGATTFGKGSVQNWIALSNEQGAVRVSIARWLTPQERMISKIGLTPDYLVELTEADQAASRDSQLEKAIDLVSSRDEKAAAQEAQAAKEAAEKRAAEAELERQDRIKEMEEQRKRDHEMEEQRKRAQEAAKTKFIAEHKISGDETLSHVALKHYGNATRPYWMVIFEANKDVIGDNPNVVRPGMVLNIPELPEELKKK